MQHQHLHPPTSIYHQQYHHQPLLIPDNGIHTNPHEISLAKDCGWKTPATFFEFRISLQTLACILFDNFIDIIVTTRPCLHSTALQDPSSWPGWSRITRILVAATRHSVRRRRPAGPLLASCCTFRSSQHFVWCPILSEWSAFDGGVWATGPDCRGRGRGIWRTATGHGQLEWTV